MSDNGNVSPIRSGLEGWADHFSSEALKGGDDGGTFDGMEERVKRLESDVSDIKKLMTDVRVTLASIDERTKHMPTHWQAFGIFLGSLAGMGAIVALTARFLP